MAQLLKLIAEVTVDDRDVVIPMYTAVSAAAAVAVVCLCSGWAQQAAVP